MGKKRRRRHHETWRYKNLTIAALGILLALLLSQSALFHEYLLHLGKFGYVGAVIAGVFYVSTFTVATSVLALIILARELPAVPLGLAAGFGAVIGDLVIFHFFKDDLLSEIVDLYHHVDHKHHVRRLMHSKYFNWMLPVVGSIIIATPLPDELGVSLLGISRLSTFQFIFLSYVLNSLGIFLFVLVAAYIH